ncbi:uncharacterized protein LOC121421881 [Lytechinus variegatus]|uniref:uncharacterized protein LOC121421881 n=1 Tax=Lytechinus variegatus TaxID=7654 RepID=UPI001BB17FE2|nr:uncharacterized protein LOC121421881 [Lytechinus variegatus]
MKLWIKRRHFVIAIHLVSCLVTWPSDALRHKIHRHMTRDELVDFFGVKSYSKVPEYEIIQPIIIENHSARVSRDQTFHQSHDSDGERSYLIYAFGKEYALDLEPGNNNVFPEHLVLHHWHGNGTNHTSLRAQRLHRNHGYYAGHVRGEKLESMVSLSEQNGKLLNGFVASKDLAFFMKPLPDRLYHLVGALRYDKQEQQGAPSPPHFVFKRTEINTCGREIDTGT